MLKMMQDIGNKLEAKMDNLQETLTKEVCRYFVEEVFLYVPQ